MTLYLIGSLENPKIPELGNVLREAGYDVFEDWHAGGPEADREWMRYEMQRGRTYKQALAGYHAHHVFNFDLHHLDRADAGILVYPAGKSAHLELGYMIGRGKPGYILIQDEPAKWDVMVLFATKVCFNLQELIDALNVNGPGLRTTDHAPWNS